MQRRFLVLLVGLALGATIAAPLFADDDPLPSWNEGPVKRAIVSFVDKVSKEGTPDFVPVSERIAAFDNDGTLWCEQPMYVQAAFAMYRVKALASQHPEWSRKQPFKAVLQGDMKTVMAEGAPAAMAILAATHAGMTPEEFERIVSDWLATARHPRFGRAYTELVYRPMLELLRYLRKSGFKTFIVSGGGVDFMRPWTSRVYGIPPEQVIGSAIKLKYELRDGQPILIRLPEGDFIDDKAGKPVGIQKGIGRRPIAVFGNSDGDYEMLRWTTAAKGSRLCLIVHHTDGEREYAYDRNSQAGRLDKALDEAPARLGRRRHEERLEGRLCRAEVDQGEAAYVLASSQHPVNLRGSRWPLADRTILMQQPALDVGEAAADLAPQTGMVLADRTRLEALALDLGSGGFEPRSDEIGHRLGG